MPIKRSLMTEVLLLLQNILVALVTEELLNW